MPTVIGTLAEGRGGGHLCKWKNLRLQAECTEGGHRAGGGDSGEQLSFPIGPSCVAGTPGMRGAQVMSKPCISGVPLGISQLYIRNVTVCFLQNFLSTTSRLPAPRMLEFLPRWPLPLSSFPCVSPQSLGLRTQRLHQQSRMPVSSGAPLV